MISNWNKVPSQSSLVSFYYDFVKFKPNVFCLFFALSLHAELNPDIALFNANFSQFDAVPLLLHLAHALFLILLHFCQILW